MRDLTKFPLTFEETKEILARILAKVRKEQAMGSLDAYALAKVANYIEKHEAEYDGYCADKVHIH